MKKLTTLKTSGEKSFVNNGTFLFSKFEIIQWKGTINKKKATTQGVGKPQACNFIKKETLAQVFSCEFCDIP